MKNLITLAFIFISFISSAQVGIGTDDPKGALDINTTNNTGLVLPRVTNIESVTDGNGNTPVNGTTIYDISRNATCFYQDSKWLCISIDTNSGLPVITDETPLTFNSEYIKASNTEANDRFGSSIALSGDGNTLAVGAFNEDSNATGINNIQTDNSTDSSGAVYLFTRSGTTWTQQAYIKASNTGVNDFFGSSISLSNDGNTLAVGAFGESSNTTSINGNQNNNSAPNSGAVYLFTRSGTTWTQQDYIKASNTNTNDRFGNSITLSNDGNTLAVGALGESSNTIGINGNQNNNSAINSGAVYIFTRSGATWAQQAYIKASNTDSADFFGFSISLSSDGNTLAVGAIEEDSNATDINGIQTDNSAASSGVVYLFTRSGVTWTQQAYIKASNTSANDRFGNSITLSGNGNTLAVGTDLEDSNAIGINGNQTDNSVTNSGAIYVFTRSGATWNQQAYIKTSNTDSNDQFGSSISLSDNGNTLVAGAKGESSNTNGINGNQTDNSAGNSGAVYVFTRFGVTWNQRAYIKASNTGSNDQFGNLISLSSDGNTLAVGTINEDSNATGINGDQTDNSASSSGAIYLYKTN